MGTFSFKHARVLSGHEYCTNTCDCGCVVLINSCGDALVLTRLPYLMTISFLTGLANGESAVSVCALLTSVAALPQLHPCSL